MRPPGFNQPNVQTNQNRYQGTNSNFNQNRGGNFNQNRQNQVYQAPPYQTPTNQPPINQVLPYQPPTNSVLKTDFENYVKANDAVLKNVQNQGQNLQNQMANVTSLLTSLCDNFKNSASTSNSGTLPRGCSDFWGESMESVGSTLRGCIDRGNRLEPDTRRSPLSSSILEDESREGTINQVLNIAVLENVQTNVRRDWIERCSCEMQKFLTNVKLVARNKEEAEENAITTLNAEWKTFLRTAKALIDLYEEKLTLRVGKDELVYYADKSAKTRKRIFCQAYLVLSIFSKRYPFSGSTTTHSDDPSPSSSPVKTSDNFVKFADELAPLDSLPPGMNLVFLNTPLSDKDECFAPEDDNDEIDDFLAIEVSSNLEEGYFDSEGDIAFLDTLLMKDSHISNPNNLSLMTVLNEISTSQGNFHQNSVIESLPMSPILVEDSEPTQEEIDILLVPDNLIPPGVEDADSEDEVNESPNLDHQDDLNSRPPPEPPILRNVLNPKAEF
ncbi:hypothetical protein Tco_0660651 [Tanacetum coccineum]